MHLQQEPLYIKPYEKFKTYGVHALSDTELVAILIRSGTTKENVLQLADRLLQGKENVLMLYQYSYEALLQIHGIGEVKAIQIMTLLELSKRLAHKQYDVSEPLITPDAIANLFMEQLRHEKYEQFVVVYLDAKCRLMSYDIVSKGSLTASIVHPREVFKGAIYKSAHSIVALHNHPSGDTTPSKEDILITKRLSDAGRLLGITLLDHIIIGDRQFKSLKEAGYL